ncbi:MAG: autotransporter adhesin family protein [Treponema sp.]|nr:autotransporter adhesin family protein [Treponema sp.]
MKKFLLLNLIILLMQLSCAKTINYSMLNEKNKESSHSLIDLLDYKTVDTVDQFMNELQRINNQGSADYAIIIKNDIFYSNITFTGNIYKTIYLKGDSDFRTITNDNDFPLFTIYKSITLVLGENISLNGNNKNAPVVLVDGGRLELLDGSSIYGASDSGVIVGINNGPSFSGGVMVMNGGVIKNNSSESGGGVFVSPRASFIMNNGTISGNKALSQEFGGGGVYISPGGRFVMNGGMITANTSNNNGGGVYIIISGLFIKNGGVIDTLNKADKNGNVAFYYSQSFSGLKKRDSTAGASQSMNSTLYSNDGGWE